MLPEYRDNNNDTELKIGEYKEQTESFNPDQYSATDAPDGMLEAARHYELKFGVKFSFLTYFSSALFGALHRVTANPEESLSNVIIASRQNDTILKDIEVLTKTANISSPSEEHRSEYFEALKRVYGKLPAHPSIAEQDQNTLFVGIEREGRILAETMSCLPRGHSIHPHAKRIPFEQGLLVGSSRIKPSQNYQQCFIIDGAIASGATIISIIEQLIPFTASFNIYSVHSTVEGLFAITRFGSSLGLNIKIFVGHATSGINKKFYAVDLNDPTKLMVGDLGDTISGLKG